MIAQPSSVAQPAAAHSLVPPPQEPAGHDKLSDKLSNLAVSATRVFRRQSSGFLRIGGSEIAQPTQVLENVQTRSSSEVYIRSDVKFVQTNLASLTRERIFAMTVEQRNALREQVKELKVCFSEQGCNDRSMLTRALYVEQELEACKTEAKNYTLVAIITGQVSDLRSEKIKEGLCYLPELVLPTEQLFRLLADALEISDRNLEIINPHRENALNFCLKWLQHNKDTSLMPKARQHLLLIANIHEFSPSQNLKELAARLKSSLEPTFVHPLPSPPKGKKDFFKECEFTTAFAKHVQHELMHHQWQRRKRLTSDCLIKAKCTNEETHPFVQASVCFFNQLSEFTTDFVLRQPDLSKCVKALKFCLKLAYLCYAANDFESTYAILMGLNSRSVDKLKKAWNKVPDKYNTVKQNLMDLFDNRENYKRYRERLREVQAQFHIPYLGLLQRDLQFLNDSTTIVSKVITRDGEEVYCTDKLFILQGILASYTVSQKQNFPLDEFRPETDFCMLVERYTRPLSELDQDQRIEELEK